MMKVRESYANQKFGGMNMATFTNSDLQSIEKMKAEKIQRKKDVALKWRKRNREMLSEYAKQYRITYLCQRKDA